MFDKQPRPLVFDYHNVAAVAYQTNDAKQTKQANRLMAEIRRQMTPPTYRACTRHWINNFGENHCAYVEMILRQLIADEEAARGPLHLMSE